MEIVELSPADPWQEEPAPDWLRPDDVDLLSDHGSRIVWGEWNPWAPLIGILDNPGEKEDMKGRPFICGTRRTLRQAGGEADLEPRDLYVTFLLKRWPRRAYDRQVAWRTYLPILHRQVREKRPTALICMGNTVVRALTDADGDVKSLRGTPVTHKGLPVVVTYHPLAARRRPNLFLKVVEDLRRARDLLG